MNLINEDDVQKVLDKFLGKRPKKISGFSVTPHGDVTTGYLGTYLTLVINFCEDEGEEKAKFFIKAHKSVDTENDFLGKSGIFQKEIDFYRVLVEDMRKTVGDLAWCPRYCFSKSRVLVLEDLSEKGYRMATGGITLDDAHLEATLKALSRMHASSILLELSKSISLDHEYPTLFKEILYNEKDINGVHAKWISWQILDLLMVVDFSEKYTHSEKAFIKENFAKQINRIYCMNKKTTKYRKVLTHGDIWKNNLLFQYEKDGPSHCKLVDFQFIRYAPPAHDVMHFLHFATEKLVRDKKESVLLRIYYENLSKELQSQGKQVESEITRDEFFESCSEYKELALIQSLLSMNYILGQSTLGVDNSNYLEYEKYLLLHRNDYMWDFINRESYKSKITELLYELIDSYIMKKFPSIKAEV